MSAGQTEPVEREPPACESAPDVVADVLAGYGVSAGEDAAGAAVQAIAP